MCQGWGWGPISQRCSMLYSKDSKTVALLLQLVKQVVQLVFCWPAAAWLPKKVVLGLLT